MKETKKYWKGLEQLVNTPEFEKYAKDEFPEKLPLESELEGEPSRRDFLKLMGFSVAAVSLAACEAPIKKAIPYIKKPESVDPGVPNYYASTYLNGSDCASIVVKTREGRPIKIEGNKMSSVSGGGTSPQIEASVLSLYDKQRLQFPLIEGKESTWENIDTQIISALSASSGTVYLVSNTLVSPSSQKVVNGFIEKYSNIKHVVYDQVSFSGLLTANEKTFGKRILPFYDFSKAKTIVSFDGDFLGAWPNSVLHNKQFASTRKVSDAVKEMSRLYSFESNLTLTGANADYRTPIKPSQQGVYIANLYNLIAKKSGAETINIGSLADDAILNKAANDLWINRGASLVISGSNDENIQILINAINYLLGNYEATIDLGGYQKIRTGDDSQFVSFVKELSEGNAEGVIFLNCNPVYDHPAGAEILSGLSKLNFSISTSDRMDETTNSVKFVAPDHHYLESWNDVEAINGKFSLSQPTISKIFNTRQSQDSFLKWSGSEVSYYDFLRTQWETSFYSSTKEFYDFDAFWNKCLHDGIFEVPIDKTQFVSDFSQIAEAGRAISEKYSDNSTNLELVIYQNNTVGNGTQANNPWLQEMSDPITKACWDNYITVSPKQANEWGLVLGDLTTQLVNLTVNGVTVSLPLLPQPGQKYNTIGLALGYGRTKAGKVADNIGVNAYPLGVLSNGSYEFNVTSGVSVQMTGEDYKLAQTQTHHTMMGRSNVFQETILSEFQKDPYAGRHMPQIATSEGFKKPSAISLWQGHKYANHHWGLMVDLNSCTGCGTCTIACQSENNIPVIGKKEVLNRRDMQWIRIDRYYSSDGADNDYAAMEVAAENPEVTFHPMMCQQCNNAPCETVCPVAATTHSTEGLNQMAYNRCIGTRYCANNCPYKVRRFNWFKFHDNDQFPVNLSMNNDLGKMVLNPDVTVRSRGVMEKCSFCVQRIQAGKLTAKVEGRRPIDGEITTACASSCPSEALVFGDMKDPESRISKQLKIKSLDKGVESGEPRAFHVLEELNVMPNVWYLTKIRNKDKV